MYSILKGKAGVREAIKNFRCNNVYSSLKNISISCKMVYYVVL